jgi:hypothetical protein
MQVTCIVCILCNESDRKPGCTDSTVMLNEQARPGPWPAGRGRAGVPRRRPSPGAPGRAGRGAHRASRRPPPPTLVARPPRQRVAGSACLRGGAGRWGRAAPARRPAARRPPRTAPAPPLVCAKHSDHIPRGNTRASPTRKDWQTPT